MIIVRINMFCLGLLVNVWIDVRIFECIKNVLIKFILNVMIVKSIV